MATRPYQGYPFTNPHVIDAPTLDAAAANRWNNLPRRVVHPPTRNGNVGDKDSVVFRPNDTPNVISKKPELESPTSNSVVRRPAPPLPEPEPVINIDLSESGSGVVRPAPPVPESHRCNKKTEPEPEPVIYIDVPDSRGSEVARPSSIPDPVYQANQHLSKIPETEPHPVIYIDVPDSRGSEVARPSSIPDPVYQANQHSSKKPEPEPVIYVDVPESRGSEVARPSSIPDPVYQANQHLSKIPETEPHPVIYIDVPDSRGSEVARPSSIPDPVYQADRHSTKKPEPEPEPVIYIDVLESSGSEVAGPATPEPEPEYVQETIFYDPFENRRIDQRKPSDTPDREDTGPPRRPNHLDLHGSGSSGYSSSTFSPRGYLTPSSFTRQDSFTLPPIPLTHSQYPEPPPAYSEIDTPQLSQYTPPSLEVGTPGTSSPSEPPQTIVITPGSELNRHDSSVGLPSPDRKQVTCQHCNHRVHTMVVWEIGPLTHCLAFLALISMMWFLLIVVYCTKLFKYKNHYCPNCNKMIGFEMAGLCIGLTPGPDG